MPELKSMRGLRVALLGAGALGVLALAACVHWFALSRTEEVGAELVRRHVETNMDDMPFGTGVCPARDVEAISGFIDDTRSDLKGGLIPAWWSPLAGIELRIERIDGITGEMSDPSGPGGRQLAGTVSVAKAGRNIGIDYSVVVVPNMFAHGVFGLLFLACAALLWRRIPGGLTDEQGFWFRALVDAGEPRKAALALAEDLPEELLQGDRWVSERRRAFDVLAGKRMYPPAVALRQVWSSMANRLHADESWKWVTQLLGQDEAGAEEVFKAVAEANATAGTGPKRAFDRLVSPPIDAAPLAAFSLVFGPDARDLDDEGWEWFDFALENAALSWSGGDVVPDLHKLWEVAIGVAKSPVTVELNMRADPPYLAVKGVRLKGFEQRGILIYYGQYLWRRLNGDGWLQNPQARARHPDLRDELLKLFDRWDAPAMMQPVLDEGKGLADRLNASRAEIKKAFGVALGHRQALLTTFQLEEEPRGRLTAYRVKLEPAQIVIREVERT